MKKNRSREEIIANILSVVMREPRKTHIMYRANLSYMLLCKYLAHLTEGKLIEYRKYEKVYVMTDKGTNYLTNYEEYKRIKNQLEADQSSLDKQATILSELVKSRQTLEIKRMDLDP